MIIEKAKEEIQKLADKLKAELDAPEEWPQINEWYWTIDSIKGGVSKASRMEDSLYFFRKSIGWVFHTKAEAQSHLDMLQATERVRSYIAKANGDWVADFSLEWQQKATWSYNHRRGAFYRELNQFIQEAEAWKHIKPELFNQLIKDCGDDIKIILGVE